MHLQIRSSLSKWFTARRIKNSFLQRFDTNIQTLSITPSAIVSNFPQ